MCNSIMNVKMRFPGGKLKAFTLSYDDGPDADEKLIRIMNSRGLKGTFNINSSMFSGAEESKARAERLKKIYIESGNEVACHGISHPRLEKLTLPEMIHEIFDDRKTIEKEFNAIVRGMAYPFGTYDETVIEALKLCGICYSRTVNATGNFEIPQNWLELKPTCHHDDSRLWDITDRFINASGGADPMLFYVWGHTFEFDRNDNWGRFEEFAEKIGGRSDVWYATNIDIYDYIEGFKRIRVSACGKIICNPNSFDIWLSADNEEFKVAPGETKRL